MPLYHNKRDLFAIGYYTPTAFLLISITRVYATIQVSGHVTVYHMRFTDSKGVEKNQSYISLAIVSDPAKGVMDLFEYNADEHNLIAIS